MTKPKILVIDDESSLRVALFRALDKRGFDVLTASTLAEGEGLAKQNRTLDLSFVDLRLPDGDGLELINRIRKVHANCQYIVLTGFGTIEAAIEATKQGVFHFVTKPFNIDEIISLTEKALENKNLTQENRELKKQLITKYSFENIIGQSGPIEELFRTIETVADTDSTILITGESGTGKELVAKAIHYNSVRADRLLVPVNCAAIPEDLLESELFGHVKGAFTGAIANRQGRFELANGGTIFLDEIGDMSPNLQVKLLRVLQERTFEPVGSTKTIEVDVRVIAATNKDLEIAVQEKKFREDLFYRLNVIPIKIPALRERKTDIPLLINHFVKYFNDSKKRDLQGFTPEALELVCSHSWPGNVRELENLIERLVILKGKGIVDIRDLPEKYQKLSLNLDPNEVVVPNQGLDFNTAVDSFENALIMQALERTGWNRNRAATLLNLNRTTLVEKIKKKGLTPPDRMI